MEIKNCQWITVSRDTGDAAQVFRRVFTAGKNIEKAELEITALSCHYQRNKLEIIAAARRSFFAFPG